MEVAFQSVPKTEKQNILQEQGNLLDSSAYLSATGKINIPIGKTEAGEVIVRDLDDIPHMLICGFTGSGKTAFVQTMLAVICKNNPPDVELIIYDSKGVEYTPFRNDPHLMLPIITERAKAVSAIEFLALESQDRFRKFAELGCKDLDRYNQMVSGVQKLPVIVFVLDDYSALNLERDELYQFQTVLKNGRIAGIHAVVISSISVAKVLQKELISNIPCRITFKLTSKTESKNVLESYGAEMLNVPGEMIYKFQSDFIKCQCAYATFENINGAMRTTKLPPAGLSALGDIAAGFFSDAAPEKKTEAVREDNRIDDLLIEAGNMITLSGKASIGYIQLMLKIGFNRAARLMDELETHGVVGPEMGTKAREILMNDRDWERYCAEKGWSNPTPSHNRSTVPYSSASYGSKPMQAVEKNEEPEIQMRNFATFEVDGVKMSVSDNRIKYTKPIMTRLGQGTISPSFTGSSVTRIVYKKPSFFSKGFFTFEFKPDTKIENPNPSLLFADISNISEIIKVQFGSGTDRTIQLFLQQISQDIGIPITRV